MRAKRDCPATRDSTEMPAGAQSEQRLPGVRVSEFSVTRFLVFPPDPPSMGGLLYLVSSIKSTRAWARAPGCEDPPTPYPIQILSTCVLTCNDDARIGYRHSQAAYSMPPPLLGMEYTETVWPTICPFLRRPWVRDADQEKANCSRVGPTEMQSTGGRRSQSLDDSNVGHWLNTRPVQPGAWLHSARSQIPGPRTAVSNLKAWISDWGQR